MKTKCSRKNGFTLVEVICALAILFIAIMPIYQASINNLKIETLAQIQLRANSLAQAEMERLKNQAAVEPGVFTRMDDLSGRLYLETRVDAMAPIEMITPSSGGLPWHFKLVFRNINIPLLGNAAQINIYDRQNNNLGLIVAKTTFPHTGLICELNFNNFVEFKGINTVRISSSILVGMGIDLSKPGTPAGALGVYCEGSLGEPLDFYFGGGLVYPFLPRYKVSAASKVQNLDIALWPGARSFIDLTTTFGADNRVKLLDQGFILTVKVFESHENYLQGGEGLAELKSIRHKIEQTGE